MKDEGLIADVAVNNLKVVRNERGQLMEGIRSDDEIYNGFGQLYVTTTFPGIIKAWYKHNKQTDLIILDKGHVKLVLFDSREDSDTHNKLNIIHSTEDNPKIIQIPPGVWHGFQAMDDQKLKLIHFNSIAYDADDLDEERVPLDSGEIPYSWNVDDK